jgi:hypothetical protein
MPERILCRSFFPISVTLSGYPKNEHHAIPMEKIFSDIQIIRWNNTGNDYMLAWLETVFYIHSSVNESSDDCDYIWRIWFDINKGISVIPLIQIS